MRARITRLVHMRTTLFSLLLLGCGSAPEDTATTAPIADTGTIAVDVGSEAAPSCTFGWKSGPSLPTGRAAGAAFTTKGFVYYLGGIAMHDSLSDVVRAKIGADGSLGAWESAGASLPEGVQDAPVVLWKDAVYVIGGRVNGAQVDGVHFAQIDASGTISGWKFFVSRLSSGPFRGALTANDEIFVFGGKFEGAITDPWHAKFDMYGHFNDAMLWAGMPKRNAYGQVALLAGRTFHVLGGRLGADVALPGLDRHYSVSADYTSKDFEGLNGAWTDGKLPVAVTRHGAAATRDRLYLVGGMQPSPSAKVFAAPLDIKGVAGAWKEELPLPEPRVDVVAAASESRVYVLGGRKDPNVGYSGGDTSASVFIGVCN
jgi:hypothetical protein